MTHGYITINVRPLLGGVFAWTVEVAGRVTRRGSSATYWGAHREAAAAAEVYAA